MLDKIKKSQINEIGHQKGKEREREKEVAADQINQRIKNNQNNYDNLKEKQ
jgi:hypothetical protein